MCTKDLIENMNMKSHFFVETYDAVVAVGAFSTTHITDVALPEILRITKKGKIIRITKKGKIIRITKKGKIIRITKKGKNTQIHQKGTNRKGKIQRISKQVNFSESAGR